MHGDYLYTTHIGLCMGITYTTHVFLFQVCGFACTLDFRAGVGEPIYYRGPHELCIIAGRPQIQLILS